jgi:hypothetical protein
MPPEAVLISVDTDRWALEESLGVPQDTYGCYFAVIGDGEYLDVWGVASILPVCDFLAWPLLVKGELVTDNLE